MDVRATLGTRPHVGFIGLNLATGDTDHKRRPTLWRVVRWAEREGCRAVDVVNLFAYRATKPAALHTATLDIVGGRNDRTIREQSAAAKLTLVGWGSHAIAWSRAREVLSMLERPMCVGCTKSGAPRHPLHIPAVTQFTPYP